VADEDRPRERLALLYGDGGAFGSGDCRAGLSISRDPTPSAGWRHRVGSHTYVTPERESIAQPSAQRMSRIVTSDKRGVRSWYVTSCESGASTTWLEDRSAQRRARV